ncbi:unnamed protein product [Didymodactylos carnosus]|uniref:Uncharacterized protein n=1 Tax=Didymodactylos carnosus TaxID=1234261 RepID=A0A815RJT4_9BILA|nr:unnamed protein product [Didymodactylos carnosus]CAF4344142.1 unnamed protein product [Didymodactylos carnosus]
MKLPLEQDGEILICLIMSDAPESVEEKTISDLKAGHAPAIKVGGMRVAAPRRTSQSDDKKTGISKEGPGDEASPGDSTAAGSAEGGQETSGENAGDGGEEISGAVSKHQPAGMVIGGEFVRVY